MVRRAKRARADTLALEQGLADDLESARRLLLAGSIVAPDGRKLAASDMLNAACMLQRVADRRVGRGAIKLQAALEAFCLSPAGMVCADIGSSTGGFTEVLLEQGACKVYAVDTAFGELAWKLRQDPRVIVLERTNALFLPPLPDRLQLVTVDLSFTSLTKALPAVQPHCTPDARYIALLKPHYEAPERCAAGGVIPDSGTREIIRTEVLAALAEQHFVTDAIHTSPIEGGGGNTEYLVLLRHE